MRNKFNEEALELLNGAYDLHVHAAPSPFDRLLDDFQLLEDAGQAGMAGIMLKSHYEPTAARAFLANAHSNSSATAYGGIVLNWPVGGLNPYAVENALTRGAKIVWMPTRDAQNSLRTGNMPGDFFQREGLTVLDERGNLKSVVLGIMDIVKHYDAALATGHLSPRESIILCKNGVKRGVRMVLTHPEFERTIIDAQTQKELAEIGVFIEKCWYNVADGHYTASEMAEHICTVGPEHCFLSSDRGQRNRERPVEAMTRFTTAVLACGIPRKDVSFMLHTVPKYVLGLA